MVCKRDWICQRIRLDPLVMNVFFVAPMLIMAPMVLMLLMVWCRLSIIISLQAFIYSFILISRSKYSIRKRLFKVWCVCVNFRKRNSEKKKNSRGRERISSFIDSFDLLPKAFWMNSFRFLIFLFSICFFFHQFFFISFLSV